MLANSHPDSGRCFFRCSFSVTASVIIGSTKSNGLNFVKTSKLCLHVSGSCSCLTIQLSEGKSNHLIDALQSKKMASFETKDQYMSFQRPN